MVWAVPVSLAATKGIARTFFLNIMAQSTIVQERVPERDAMHLFRKKVPCLLSIPPGTEMFHFPGYASVYTDSC